MKAILEQIDRVILESRGDYYWVSLPFNKSTAASLSRGRLEGLKGVSGSRSILDWWFGGGKAALRMERRRADQSNSLMSVSGMRVKDFIVNDLEVMQRLMDQPSFGTTLSKFVHNYIKPRQSKLGRRYISLVSPYLEDRKLYRFLDRYKTSSEISDWIDLIDTTQPVHHFAWIIEKSIAAFARKSGNEEDADALRDALESKIDDVVRDAIKGMKNQYAAAEDEYVVAGGALEVPKGSDLFVFAPRLSDRAERLYIQWRDGVESKEIDMLLSIRGGADFKDRANAEDLVDRFGLDNKYSVSFVSDADEIPRG